MHGEHYILGHNRYLLRAIKKGVSGRFDIIISHRL